MKILHVSPSYYPAFKYGGPIQSVHILNKEIVKNGTLVDVLTTNSGLDINQKKLKTNGNWHNIDGVRIKYFNYYGYEHFNFSISLVIELFKIIVNYDLIHITAVWNFPVLIAGIISLFKNRPFIISPRGALYKESVNFRKRRIKKIYYKLLIKGLLNKSNAIHFTSDFDRDRFFEFTKIQHKNFIVPNGIELEKLSNQIILSGNSQKYKLYKNRKYMLYLGRINTIKGLDILIKAFAKMSSEFKDINLILAGPDNEHYSQNLMNIILAMNLENRIYFTGLLGYEEKIDFLKNALIFILPSYSENFGNVVIESMACETPVIISDNVGIYKEVEKANAGLIVKTDIYDLYNGIKRLIENKELRKTIAANGKKLVEDKYNIAKIAEQMVNTYENILSV